MKNKALYFRGICKGARLPLALKAIQILQKEGNKKKIKEALIIGIYYTILAKKMDDDFLTNLILSKNKYSDDEYRRMRKLVDKSIAKILKLHKEAIYIFSFCKAAGLLLAKKAVLLACELHKNQFRRDGRAYVEHVLEVCRYLINFGIRDSIILAAALLHDTVEDKRITLEKLKEEIGDAVSYLVNLLTKHKRMSVRKYYENLKADVRAIIIKAADRTSNVSDMIKSFSTKRLEKYIKETEKIILPIMKEARKMYSEYSDILIILRDRIISVLLPIKEVVRLRKLLDYSK